MLRWSELRQLKQGLVWRERIMCLGRTSSGKRIARPTTTLQGLSFRNRSSLRFPVRFRWRLRIEVRGEARPDFCFPGNPSTLDTAEQRWGAARAARDQATAEASLTRLDVAIATVNAYLTVLAAQRTMRAADADVQRRDTFDKAVRVLVENQLRAGADSSRADAELARARVNLARTQQQEKISRAALADILGLPDTSVAVVEGSLIEPPPGEALQTTPITNNPVAEVQHARRRPCTGPYSGSLLLPKALSPVVGVWTRQRVGSHGQIRRRNDRPSTRSFELGGWLDCNASRI